MQLARGDVVDDHVTEDVIKGTRLRNVPATDSDHGPQLHLPIQPRGQPLRIGDGIAGSDDGRGRLREINRRRRRRTAGFGGVGRIVLTETNHVLARPRNRRMPADPVRRIGEAGLRVLRKVMTVELRQEAAAQVGGVAPGRRPGFEQAQHVRRETQAVM